MDMEDAEDAEGAPTTIGEPSLGTDSTDDPAYMGESFPGADASDVPEYAGGAVEVPR